MQPLFITGIGTDVGKTVIAAIVTEAIQASYWKPVQAGFDQGTDSQWVADRITHSKDRIWQETYRLALPASPHIAARKEGLRIDLDHIAARWNNHRPSGDAGSDWLVIEGAGGLLVPLNEEEFIADLAVKLKAPLLLVSRNYLGSINHSLLTARVARSYGLPVAGWIFNGEYGHYEQEIVKWSGIPFIGSVPHSERPPDAEFIQSQAVRIRASLQEALTSIK